MIYLDYQATTPLAPEAREAMEPWLGEQFANPHSPYTAGRMAAAAISVARDQLSDAIGLPGGQAVFTGSATEAINWAIRGTMEKRPERSHIVTIATEHAAVLDTVEWLGRRHDVTILPVDSNGLVDLDQLREAVSERTALVAAMLVNNEIGVIQPVDRIAEIAHSKGAWMLCDAVQGLGRIPIPEGPDLVAVSGHKIHGPKAIGALWMREGCEPAPLIHGGGQEAGLRSGTLSPALCVGFGAAAKLAGSKQSEDRAHVAQLWEAATAVLGPEWTINGDIQNRYRGNLNIRREGLDAARLLEECRDIAMSLGSACASGSGRPSHVLRALGLSDREARSSIRLGFGRYTDKGDLTEAIGRINEAARKQGV
ncbi:cysteine desulfurase family protein [Sphingomicrobium lutaoense]|uniref:Cysteine desulfurase n=1 Tax=Sphingomicrobium lutaoense TaxID=515949 RepID=A0A839YU26_9SPHN|nr:cysteine desulfurase family protein [Sphingomicrobium lutaoense]MBB3763761.1 cysteine desulfurase [Sphingomicrobium lutaoense]